MDGRGSWIYAKDLAQGKRQLHKIGKNDYNLAKFWPHLIPAKIKEKTDNLICTDILMGHVHCSVGKKSLCSFHSRQVKDSPSYSADYLILSSIGNVCIIRARCSTT